MKRYFEPQFIRFVLVAMLNTAFGLFVNYLFLFIFEHLLKFNHAYIISNFIATIVSILFNFKTYGILVFKNKDNKLILRFLAVTTFTYLLNIGGIALLEHLGSQNNYINLTIMAVPVGLLNYVLNSVFVYKRKVRFFNNRKNNDTLS
ncbi:MAG: GtrA family protein [Bacteroidales bacterium]|nr:GtrA family protein [Bacteroidales bacterium]